MIYDIRTYTCRPGTIRAQLALYHDHGWAPQCRHLGGPVLYGQVETGDVNSFVHIWRYEDAADRAAKRAAMVGDADWQAYLTRSAQAGNLVSQVNTIATGTAFFDG